MENTEVIETQVASEPVVEKTNEALAASCKRALEEVNALEMMQQVLAMVERSMQKVGVKDYDTTGVRKYLHELYGLAGDCPAEEINGMEFIFWQEVQLWRSALAHRDGFISVSDLRHYCESSRPPLSEQALLALARFYRGLSASEKTTSKFDMIITRIFSRDEEDGTRRLAGGRNVIAEALDDHYREWLGISPQQAIEDEKIIGAVTRINEFIARAQEAETFEGLIGDSFFGSVKEYKKELNQIFYAPQVAAAAIDCNIRIGNRFVELLEQYRQEKKAEGRGTDPLDPLLEQAVSETTNKTLQIVYEAKKKHLRLNEQRERQRLLDRETLHLPDAAEKPRRIKQASPYAINKWLLMGGLIAVLSSGMLYLWVEYGSAENTGRTAQKLNEKELPGGEYLAAARVNNNAFFGVVSTKWNALTEDNKKKVLDQLVSAGKDKGYNQVSLLNNDGKMVGHASANGIKLF